MYPLSVAPGYQPELAVMFLPKLGASAVITACIQQANTSLHRTPKVPERRPAEFDVCRHQLMMMRIGSAQKPLETHCR